VGVSSARPDDLKRFSTRSRSTDHDLRGDHSQLLSLYRSFIANNHWGHFEADSMLAGFGKWLEWNGIDAAWVKQIAITFEKAGGDGALKYLPDSAIKASLRAAGLDFDRKHVTFDDPVAYGFPPTTGYSDDPVNTASGNFVALETDLPFTGLAQSLRFGRVYNSRSDRAGAFGPGWSSWADVRLRARPDGAEYEGPDGQRATFGRMGAGYGRVVGVDAAVRPLDAGLALHWFDGRRWEFDQAGLLVLASEGPGHDVRFAHEDGRLVALTHRGGKVVRLQWDADRVCAVDSSDGRTVGYEYDDGRLTAADPPEGLRRYDVANDGRLLSITDADGVVEVVNDYDEDGRVLEQLSPFGRRTLYGYLPGHVTVVADEEEGPLNTYVHDRTGRVVAIVDGNEQPMSFQYDEHGYPTAVTERNGAVTLQEWDDEARLLRRVLPAGPELEFSYDDAGRIVEVRTATGEATAYVYQGDERSPVEIIDPEGGLTRLTVRDGLVHEVVDPDGVSVSFDFDDDGNMVAAVDADGNDARVERDTAGRVLAAVTPLGRRTTFHYDAQGRLAERHEPGGGVWRFDYTAAGRLAGVTDPSGAREEMRYGEHGQAESLIDALGRVTARRYDTFGNLTTVVEPDGAKWLLGYDALARPRATTDPTGAVWQREYDVNGNQTASVDPVGARQSATYDVAGRVTGLSDGLTSSAFEFDALGRTRSHRRPDGSEVRAEYDRCGRTVALIDPSGGTTRIEYTAAGRERVVTAPSGAAETYEYDRCGRAVARTDGEGRRWEYRYDADGALVEQLDPAGDVERFEYDDTGRLTAWTQPGRGLTTYAYDQLGRTVAISDRISGTRRFDYDGAGRLVGATDANGQTTRYAYNERGWLTKVVDPLGASTTRTYDEVGRLTSETDPLGRTRTLTYDAAGQLVEETDASGRRTRWAYDVSGRVSTYGPAGEAPITIARDELGREVEIREPGSFTHQLRWDAEDRLVERRRDASAITWGYDEDGHRAAFGFPDGSQTTYRHDAGGYLVAMQHAALGEIALERDPAGRLTGAVGAGMRARWTYEGGDLSAYDLVAGDRRRAAQLTRDPVGRVVAALVDGDDQRFSYDAAGQLVSAETSAGGFEFSYDVGGRLAHERTPAGEVAYEHDRAGQLVVRRPVAGSSTRYEYDSAGRRVVEQQDDLSRRYRWDGLGRLTAVETGERTTSVAVDALGELASVDAIPLLWDTADPLSPLASLGEQAVVGLGSPWATAGAGTREWLAPDWQGTVGAPRDPWGAPGAPAGPQFGFRGEVEFAGDVWLRNRLYQPTTRSFLQPDPWPPEPGVPSSANPYHYAANDPIEASDPLGLKPVSDADLQKYRDQMNETIWEKGADFLKDNWEYAAAGAMVAVGGVLVATGVGGPAGLALINGGISVGMQKAMNGKVSLGQLAMDVAPVGRIFGVARRAAGPLTRAAGPLAGRARQLVSKLNPSRLVKRLLGRAPAPAARLPQDLAVSPVAPPVRALSRPVGSSVTQNAHVQQRIRDLQAQGASDFRVNQQQVNIAGERVGINRPDLQYTHGARRRYEEFDVPGSNRGPGHKSRLEANDPAGEVELFVVP